MSRQPRSRRQCSAARVDKGQCIEGHGHEQQRWRGLASEGGQADGLFAAGALSLLHARAPQLTLIPRYSLSLSASCPPSPSSLPPRSPVPALGSFSRHGPHFASHPPPPPASPPLHSSSSPSLCYRLRRACPAHRHRRAARFLPPRPRDPPTPHPLDPTPAPPPPLPMKEHDLMSPMCDAPEASCRRGAASARSTRRTIPLPRGTRRGTAFPGPAEEGASFNVHSW